MDSPIPLPSVSAAGDGVRHDAQSPVVIDRAGLQAVIDNLRALGYRVAGPTIRDSAIVYDEIASLGDLPEGWTDEQDGGTYRLRRRDDSALFGYAVGPHSWKKYLFPPRNLLWKGQRDETGFTVTAPADDPPPYAFFGVRGCELAAIAIQDKVFDGDIHADPHYGSVRRNAFLVGINCGTAGGTCFCVSMGTGPRVGPGYDLALTELISQDRHEFLVEVGSDRGSEVLAGVAHREATEQDVALSAAVTEHTAATMGRQLDTTDIKDLLYRNYEHARWDDVASRCLACANCTMVCPTCFCNTVEDSTDLTGDVAERWRTWDSCFSLDFSRLGGGSVRTSTRSRYRQWMTHKLATWFDQFGSSGCVGCGRCITWCPVAIDLTQEVAAIRASDSGGSP
ncbi:MAG TPA: 4Fe-4S dicluster domain-containing protein [Acidimicrobiia bacterium]|jgi:formate hydrogenlyase subunit 6/NADH:ubiquinone oxidoreductase subunit I